MALETIEALQQSLDRDLAWRKKEISGLRISVLRSEDSRHYLFRAGLVLLCAHWEGFLKRSVSLYLSHVFGQQLSVRDFAPEIVAVAYYADVKKAAMANYPGSEEHHLALARRILLGTDEVCTNQGWQVDTEANPSTELLGRVLASIRIDDQLGMDRASWSAMCQFIDEQLLRDRHLVAHGEGFRVERSQFLERAGRLSQLLESLHAQLLYGATSRSYRAAP